MTYSWDFQLEKNKKYFKNLSISKQRQKQKQAFLNIFGYIPIFILRSENPEKGGEYLAIVIWWAEIYI